MTAQIPAESGGGADAVRPGRLMIVQRVADWAKRVVFVRASRPHPVAWMLMIATILATIVGLGFGIVTRPAVRQAIFATFPVHAVVVFAVFMFCLVGFLLLRRDEPAGRLFATAALLGSIVYLASSYADWAIEDRGLTVPGGVIAGWIGDVLFLPSIAALLPVFLATIPNGGWPKKSVLRWLLVGLLVLGTALLLVAALFEPHLVTHPFDYPPLHDIWLSRNAVMRIGLIGSLLFCVAIFVSGLVAWARAQDFSTTDRQWHQIHWYAYGAAFAVAALIPFLILWFGSLFSWNPFSGAPELVRVWGEPRAPSLVKVWGALMVTPVAVTAMRAMSGAKWRPGRIRRLVWAVVIGTLVAVVHEASVLIVVHPIEDRIKLKVEPALDGQVLIVYAATLVIAAAFEPISELFRKGMEHFPKLRATSWELLEEAKRDVKNVNWQLGHAKHDADKLCKKYLSIVLNNRPPSQRVLQTEVSELLKKMNGDFEESRELIKALNGVFDRLASSSEPGPSR